MEAFFLPTLADELVETNTPCLYKTRERLQTTQKAETLLKDDQLWKELQQELARTNTKTKAGIQEVTRKFLEKHQHQLLNEGYAGKSRRSSETMGSRRTSLCILAAKSRKLARAMSVSEVDGKNRDSLLSDFMNNSVSKSLSKFDLSFSTLSARFEMLEMESSVSGSEDFQYSLSGMKTEESHHDIGTLGGIDESVVNGHLGESRRRDEELLVTFPTGPRRSIKTASSA